MSFLVASCASGPPPGPSPAQLAGINAKTILVAPFNIVSSLPPDLEGSTKMVSKALVDHLEAHGKTVKVISFRSGNALWKESMKEVSASGEKRIFENAAKVYARKIGKSVEFDVLIVPSLFIQNAKMMSRVARWDGAEQRMKFEGDAVKNRGQKVRFQTGSWSVRAASIFAYVLDRGGNTIQSKKSGLEVIQHMRRTIKRRGGQSGSDDMKIELVNDMPPIDNIERVQAGVAAVLSPFLAEEVPALPPENLDTSPSPESAGQPDPS